MFTKKEVLRFVEENDVKFVRLAFCDLLGVVKNVSVMSAELPHAFERGVAVDAKAVVGYSEMGEEELLLIPDPGTLSMLPWRPRASGVIRLFCDLVRSDGTPFDGDGRRLLENAAKSLQKAGVNCVVGTDCQFYLFDTDEKGKPTLTTVDEAEYLDVAPLDKGEDIRRDICLTLDSLGMEPTTSHHEKGPGQNEIDFKHSEAISAADNFLTFKLLVKAIGARNGVYATFIPRPKENAPASWLNLDLKLSGREAADRAGFVTGIKNRLNDIALFLNPSVNIYEEGGGKPEIQTDTDYSGVKLKGLDPTCNPYLAFALLINAGLDGLNNREKPLETKVPDSFEEAVNSAEKSEFLKKALPEKLLDAYINTAKQLREGYVRAENKAEYVKSFYFEKM